jgi:MoaA/NifB/PqqE/SkfB family radical SAM enzyme
MIVYTGFACGLRCQFCYYLKSLEDGTAKNFSLRRLKIQLWLGRKIFGMNDVDFTGGEATQHRNITELIGYSKHLGYNDINVITNGWRLSDLGFYERLKNHGLNETLFSLHSHVESTHDSLTQVKGSYKKLITAMENAQKIGINIRINKVINPLNILKLDEYFEFVQRFNPAELNLIIYNPSEETVGYVNHENVRINSYDDIGLQINKTLAQFGHSFKKINLRFIPFCYVKGNEDKVRLYTQEIYESQEWNPFLHWFFRKNFLLPFGAVFASPFLFFLKPNNVLFGRKNLWTLICELLQLSRTFLLFSHANKCEACNLKKICPGLPKELIKKNKDISVFPYLKSEIPQIVNPVFFGQNDPEKFKSFKDSL